MIIDTNSKSFQRSFTIALFFISALLFSLAAYSWTGPSGTAPNNNVAAPINTGSTSQVKSGALSVNGLSVSGSQQIQTALGIGVAPNSIYSILAQNNAYGIYADATYGQAVRGQTTAGGYAGYFVGGGTNGGGLYAQNSGGYYSFLGYPGSTWSVYSNGPTYTGSYSRADGGFCIGGDCISSWTPSSTYTYGSCAAAQSGGTCTAVTPSCPSGYARSGCSYGGSALGMYSSAYPYSSAACACAVFNASGASQTNTCYTYCVR